jgi:hypothetical protein
VPVRPVDLTVRDGTVVWGDPSNGGVSLTHLEASARSRRLPAILRGTALGQVERLGRTAGTFSVEFDAASRQLGFRGSVSGWDLAALAPPGIPRFEGEAAGTISARLTSDAPEISVDLDVDGLLIDHPSLREPITPQETRVVAEVAWRREGTEVRLRRLQIDDLTIRGEIGVDDRPQGRIRADLSVDRFRAGGPKERLQLLRLVGLRHDIWRRFDERTQSGELEVARFQLDVPRSQLVDTLAFRRKVTRRELRVTARIRDALYRPHPKAPPLENVSAEIRVRGNRLEVYDLRMIRSGGALPEIDVTVQGLHRLAHLPRDERYLPAGPGVSTPGLGPAFSSLSGGGRPDGEVTRVVLSDLALAHPIFVLPIRNATAVVSFPSGNVLVESFDGVLGGAPAKGRGLWDRENNRVVVDIVYQDGDAPEGVPPTSPWVEASCDFESVYFGPWRAEKLGAHVRGIGSQVEIREVDGWMTEGTLLAEGTADLSQEGHAPVQISFELTDAHATDVADTLELTEGTLDGVLDARGSVDGRLDPEIPFLAQAQIDLQVEIEDGTLANLPVTVTLARLSSPTGWGALFGRPLGFEQMDMRLRTESGTLHISDFELRASELRMLCAGRIELMDEGRPIDLLLALLLFRGMDRVIGTVPWIGDWVLGEDESLVAFYFRLEGTWEEPDGRYVPPDTLRAASGWAERLVVGGVRRLGKLLGAGGGSGTP